MNFKLINNKFWYILLAFCAFLVAMYGLTFRQISYFWFSPFTWNQHQVPARIHFITGPIVLILGIFQFSVSMRKKYPTLHCWLGRIYVLSLLISSGSVFAIYQYSAYGTVVQVSLLILNIIWLLSVLVALFFILVKKNITLHQYWMTRNYALTCSAITLRIIFGVLWGILGDQGTAYQIAVASCYIINIIIGEIIIYQYKKYQIQQNGCFIEKSQDTQNLKINN
ncbi:membrane protein (macronuclear) [Tetrahymena thermophila SB210]|uniref:Membrane protein n=1 Tax=Tetrahymena thermophila (strain SB210) TaxID=312017 RepID=W7X322_TETTS|nr:membrane protein [Tetrahymena thermophila SB210]EWS71847.1 membrane protein [Tetrahymena thermophila SB210]|eukprot:XP_012655591.1 membrane protein [Tetrahymena thermophila SB210]